MLSKLLSTFAQKLGRKGYELDPNFKTADLLELSIRKLFQLLRFWMFRFKFCNAGWMNFFGSNITVLFGRNVTIGNGVNFGNNIYLNALSRAGIKIGDNVTIKTGTKIDCSGVYSELGEGIIIGDRVGISENCFIQVRGNVLIEDDVIIGPSVMIISEDHVFDEPKLLIRQQGTSRQGVTIGNGAWLGAGAIILDGVTIGSGAIVGAGAVVTKNVTPQTIVAGVPARLITTLN